LVRNSLNVTFNSETGPRGEIGNPQSPTFYLLEPRPRSTAILSAI